MALLKTVESAAHLFVIVSLPVEEIEAMLDTSIVLLKYGSTICAAAKAEKVDIAITKATATNDPFYDIFPHFSPLLPHSAPTTL